jgi:L-ribulose-5-phosphate 3-epimerase
MAFRCRSAGALSTTNCPWTIPQIVSRYLSLSSEHKIPIDGTCVDKLHDNGLKSDKLAIKWVLDSIRLTSALRTQRAASPVLRKMGHSKPGRTECGGRCPPRGRAGSREGRGYPGLEDMISAEDNVRIMDRTKSKNVSVYYDIGNSTASRLRRGERDSLAG